LTVTILGICSVLTKENYMGKIDQAFSEGLMNKAFIVRPYAELFAEFLSLNDFTTPDRDNLVPLLPSLKYEDNEHEQLEWIQSDGIGYSKERAEEFIKNRYKNALKPIKFTLTRLLEDEGFRDSISSLRNEGYLDWCILLMVSNIIIDYRANQLIPNTAPLAKQVEITKKLMFKEESENEIEVPLSIFTKERFNIQKKITIAAIAKTWGLEIHQKTPDFVALEKLLNVIPFPIHICNNRRTR